jgi:ureidoglycolate lyase
MEISRFLVLVCPTDPAGDPDLARMMAFVGARDQGICYRPDVWHHPFGVLDAPSQCTVLRFDMRNEEDTVWFEATDGPRIVGPAES